MIWSDSRFVYEDTSCIKFTEHHFVGYLGHKIWRHLDERPLVNQMHPDAAHSAATFMWQNMQKVRLWRSKVGLRCCCNWKGLQKKKALKKLKQASRWTKHQTVWMCFQVPKTSAISDLCSFLALCSEWLPSHFLWSMWTFDFTHCLDLALEAF